MKHYLKKLEEQVHLRADKPALCDYGGASFTYAQVASKIEELHIFFQAAGIRKGEKIALCARNSARWAIFFLAVNTYETVIVPILADFTARGASQLVRHSDSVLLIADPEIWEQMDPYAMPNLRAVLDAKEDGLLFSRDTLVDSAWEERKALFKDCYPEGFNAQDVVYPTPWEDASILNYTSGTSGDPKGVMLSYATLSDVIESYQKYLINTPEQLVSMLPLAHMYGLSVEFLYPCCTGFTIHFLGKAPSPTLLMQSMQEIKPSLMVTVPLVMEKIYANLIRPMLDTRSAKAVQTLPGLRHSFYKSIGKKVLSLFGGKVQTIFIGGAPLNWQAESTFKKIGLPYSVGYGLTEGGPLLAMETPQHFVAGSCGKPVHDMRVISSDPERIPGEIQFRGPNMMLGYYKNPEADKQVRTPDGWIRTGDLGVMDEDGNLFIRGRIKALILSASGQNIYPEEVEQVLSRHALVEESLVLERGGKVVALVYPREGTFPAEDEEEQLRMADTIRNETNVHLPGFSRIFRVELVDIPFERTAKGSIKRHLYQ